MKVGSDAHECCHVHEYVCSIQSTGTTYTRTQTFPTLRKIPLLPLLIIIVPKTTTTGSLVPTDMSLSLRDSFISH